MRPSGFCLMLSIGDITTRSTRPGTGHDVMLKGAHRGVIDRLDRIPPVLESTHGLVHPRRALRVGRPLDAAAPYDGKLARQFAIELTPGIDTKAIESEVVERLLLR